METYVLFDEEMGECQVFLELVDAMNYFEQEDYGKWNRPKGDDTLWMSEKGLFYIFKREIKG